MPTSAQTVARILLVEDEPKLRASVAEGLQLEDWSVVSVATASEAQRLLASGGFDLAVLDWMLPDGDGLEIVRQVRAQGSAMPILLISARGGSRAEVDVKQSGATGFLEKPFSFDELLARVRALLARTA